MVVAVVVPRFHMGCSNCPRRTVCQRRITPTAKHNSTATIDASGPNAPPVKIVGPRSIPWLSAALSGPPETDIPKMNQLQAVALNEGLRCKKKLWRERGREQLESFRLAPWASRRRRDLLELLDRLNPTIAELSQAIQQEVEKCPEARRLMTHPGVGPFTALAFVLIIGEADRFQCGKQVASYLGLVPLEDSSGNRRRLGHITKQGSSMPRFLLVEAAQVTARSLPQWRSKYLHLMMRRGRKTAKVAMARRLAVHLYWMMRQGWHYQQWIKFGSHAGQLGNRHGVQ